MTSSRRTNRAFTLIELLVVISILVLILAIAVPAFSTLVYTSDQSMAENALRAGLSSARDAAARGASGQDAAAVFVYDQGRVSIVPAFKAGTIIDNSASSGIDMVVEREVFAPIPGITPLQLPRLWMVRGYAPGGTIDAEWYEDTHTTTAIQQRGNWLFPETSFFDLELGDDGYNRQTFIVRFEGGTGRLKTSDPTGVLVLLPSPATEFRRTSSPWSLPGYRADREADGARFIRRVAASTLLTPANRSLLLGDEASDTVLAKPVAQLAIYNEKRLAGALGARINDQSGCLYLPFTSGGPGPQYVQMPAGIPAGQESTAINAWIEDRLPNTAPDRIRSDARIFGIHTYLGWLQEMTGSFEGAVP